MRIASTVSTTEELFKNASINIVCVRFNTKKIRVCVCVCVCVRERERERERTPCPDGEIGAMQDVHRMHIYYSSAPPWVGARSPDGLVGWDACASHPVVLDSIPKRWAQGQTHLGSKAPPPATSVTELTSCACLPCWRLQQTQCKIYALRVQLRVPNNLWLASTKGVEPKAGTESSEISQASHEGG